MPGETIEMTTIDAANGEPERTTHLHVAPQGLRIAVEWPLPGTAYWSDSPTGESPSGRGRTGMFDTDAGRSFDCDGWLARQLVMFDGRGVSLKDVIRTVANYEGAHSIGVGRLAQIKDEEDFGSAKRPDIHILHGIGFFGIRYGHIVVIETAMYIYEQVIGNKSVERPLGGLFVLRPWFEGFPEEAGSSSPSWLDFDGGTRRC